MGSIGRAIVAERITEFHVRTRTRIDIDTVEGDVITTQCSKHELVGIAISSGNYQRICTHAIGLENDRCRNGALGSDTGRIFIECLTSGYVERERSGERSAKPHHVQVLDRTCEGGEVGGRCRECIVDRENATIGGRGHLHQLRRRCRAVGTAGNRSYEIHITRDGWCGDRWSRARRSCERTCHVGA